MYGTLAACAPLMSIGAVHVLISNSSYHALDSGFHQSSSAPATDPASLSTRLTSKIYLIYPS